MNRTDRLLMVLAALTRWAVGAYMMIHVLLTDGTDWAKTPLFGIGALLVWSANKDMEPRRPTVTVNQNFPEPPDE